MCIHNMLVFDTNCSAKKTRIPCALTAQKWPRNQLKNMTLADFVDAD